MVGIVVSIVDFVNERHVRWESISQEVSIGGWVVGVRVVMMGRKGDVGRRDDAIECEAHEIPGVRFVKVGGVIVEELSVFFGVGDFIS